MVLTEIINDFFSYLKVVFNLIKLFILRWWWIFLPFLLFKYLKFYYLWYIQDRWYEKNVNPILLEIKIPENIEKPIKAMEQVIENFWTIYDPPNAKEKWFEGKFLVSFSMEIVAIDGKVHFFIRVPKRMREIFESAIYSQYPEVEIFEVIDYTKAVPQNIPNRNWDIWGCDITLLNKTFYPIKTYEMFFEPSPELKEEKVIDPLSVLVEGMSRLNKGEQMWFQIRAKPFANEIDWVKEAQNKINEIAGRAKKEIEDKRTILGEASRALIYGKVPFEPLLKKEEEPLIPALKLLQTEQEIIKLITKKIEKHGFETNIRFVYVGKRNVFTKTRIRLMINFLSGLSLPGLNGLKVTNTTKVTPPALFRQIKLYSKQRAIFRRYVRRYTPFYPDSGGTYVLNAEELATLFHFPSEISTPSISLERITARKISPPPFLPLEEEF
ncbi:MAG: hypothetical protein ACP5H7_01675 [Minisyncoccia bacterium]